MTVPRLSAREVARLDLQGVRRALLAVADARGIEAIDVPGSPLSPDDRAAVLAVADAVADLERRFAAPTRSGDR